MKHVFTKIKQHKLKVKEFFVWLSECYGKETRGSMQDLTDRNIEKPPKEPATPTRRVSMWWQIEECPHRFHLLDRQFGGKQNTTPGPTDWWQIGVLSCRESEQSTGTKLLIEKAKSMISICGPPSCCLQRYHGNLTSVKNFMLLATTSRYLEIELTTGKDDLPNDQRFCEHNTAYLFTVYRVGKTLVQKAGSLRLDILCLSKAKKKEVSNVIIINNYMRAPGRYRDPHNFVHLYLSVPCF